VPAGAAVADIVPLARKYSAKNILFKAMGFAILAKYL
jgi:hypothetical protein